MTKTIKHPELADAMGELLRALTARMTPRQLHQWTTQAKIACALLRERRATGERLHEAVQAAHELLRELIRSQKRLESGSAPGAPEKDVQRENNLKDRINSLERELWTYSRTEPSEDAVIAAFYALYGRKGGRPTDARDGPELVAVFKGLVAAYVVDFGAALGSAPPRLDEYHAARVAELEAEVAQGCDRCDGCGWYEGGATLKTTCEKCGGTGVRGSAPPAVMWTNTRVREQLLPVARVHGFSDAEVLPFVPVLRDVLERLSGGSAPRGTPQEGK